MAGLNQFSIKRTQDLPKLFGMDTSSGAKSLSPLPAGGGFGNNQGNIGMGTKQLARLASAYSTMQSALPNQPFDPNANLRNAAEAMQLKLAQSNALAGINANRQAMANNSLKPNTGSARASGKGQGAPLSLSQQPYQSDIGKDTSGTSSGLTGLPSPNKMASYQPVVSNPLANLNNPQANQASLAASSATPATTKPTASAPRAGGSPGNSPMANPNNAAIAGGLDPTKGNNFLSNTNTGLTALDTSKAPGSATPATVSATSNKDKPGKSKSKSK